MADDPMNRKAYINRWERRTDPENPGMDYWFCSKPDHAAYWPSREIAERDCRATFNGQITIPSVAGGRHTIDTFDVEEFEGKFIVSCHGPFIYQASPGDGTTCPLDSGTLGAPEDNSSRDKPMISNSTNS